MRILSYLLTASLLSSSLLFAAEDGKKKARVKPEAQFKKWDENGDGKLSLSEYVGKKTAAEDEAEFKKLDKDGDGSLNLEEFLAGAARGKKKK